MSTRQPPRFVPTLTEVVQPGRVAVPRVAIAMTAGVSDEEQLVQRVMQRVELGLERHLREAIAIAVLEHTRDLGDVVRAQVERVVRQAVSQAIAEEAQASRGSGGESSPCG